MTSLSHQRLFIHDHLNARELSEVYISEQTNGGQLFVMLELPKVKIDQQPQIDEIIRTAANQFGQYQGDNPEANLEQILQRLNQLLPEIIPPKINHWLNTLDLVIGIIHGNGVYLASLGSMQGLLIHHNQITPILEKTEKINLLKIFSDIVSGELDQEDALIVSTNALFDYISQEKIRQIIKRYTPQAAVQEIKSLLETVPNFVNFNSLVIKRVGQHDLNQVAPKPQTADRREEAERLTPPHQLNDKNLSKGRQTKTKLVIDYDNLQKVKLVSWLKFSLVSAKYFFQIVGKVCLAIWRGIITSYRFLTSKQYRLENENNLLEKIQNKLDERLSWFTKLNWQRKVLLIGLFMVSLIFLQSLVFLTQEKSLVKKDLVYDQTIQRINNTLNDVQSSLIYNDEKRAEELLLEIQAMLNGLEPNSEERKIEIAKAQEKTNRILNEVRHINYVPDPLELADLSNLNQPQQIIHKNNNIYLLDKDKLYQLADNQTTALADFANGTVLADWSDQNKLILGNNDNFLIYDLQENKVENFSFNKTNANTQIQDVAVFGNNLYVLDTTNSQIFKYPARGQSFTGGQSWLQESMDLANIYSFTIDGDVYLIDKQGLISKLNRGRKTDFNYHQPHPLLGSRVIIRTFTDSNYLYMIDPDNQRVLILDKEGTIKDQYTSPKFNNLTDLTINADETGIYLLNGNKIYLLAIHK